MEPYYHAPRYAQPTNGPQWRAGMLPPGYLARTIAPFVDAQPVARALSTAQQQQQRSNSAEQPPYQERPQTPELKPSPPLSSGAANPRHEQQLLSPHCYDKALTLTPPAEDVCFSDISDDSAGAAPDCAAIVPETVIPSSDKKKRKKKGQPKERKRSREKGDEHNDDQLYPSTKRTPISALAAPLAKQSDLFTEVVGRLNVVGYQHKYTVTTDEVNRRTSLPECLNRSLLGPLLRRGKIPGCGNDLKELLEKQGLTVDNRINRKRHPLTAMSGFLEGEAIKLAADHREHVFAHFPSLFVTRIIVSGFRSPADAYAAAAELKLAKAAVAELGAVIESWTAGGWSAHGGPQAAMRSELAEFALATHGFGVEEARMWATFFTRIIDLLEEELAAQLRRVVAAADADDDDAIEQLTRFPAGTQMPTIPVCAKPVVPVAANSNVAQIITDIPGRLTLTNKRYNVSLGEIVRRTCAPECTNLSLLSSQLRMGKTATNVSVLRDSLAKHGVCIEPGRRKGARATLFTALTESEAIALATDMDTEMKRRFPYKPLAEALIASNPAIEREAFCAASRIASTLEDAARSMELPLTGRALDTVPEHAYHMLNYSSLTHGYGPDAAISWFGAWEQLFKCGMQLLSKA